MQYKTLLCQGHYEHLHNYNIGKRRCGGLGVNVVSVPLHRPSRVRISARRGGKPPHSVVWGAADHAVIQYNLKKLVKT